MSITKCLKTAAKVLGAFVFASAFVACVPELPSALDPLGVTSKGGSGGGGSSTQPETTAPEVEVEGEIERVTPNAEVTTVTIPAPSATATTGVNPDADIVVVASTKPNKVEIFESGNNTAIDTINAANETYYSGGDSGAITSLKVKDQLITLVYGNVIVKPHAKSDGTTLLEYNKTYTVKFDGTDAVSFTTKTTAPTPSGTIKVGSSATADFGSIQGALNYLTDKSGDWTIELEEGSYHERLFYKGSVNLTIKGPADSGATAYGDKAIIYWKNNNQWNESSRTRVNFLWQGGDLTLKNLTLKSTYLRKDTANVTAYGDDGKDARNEVLNFDVKNHLVVNDCSFIGTQDTLILGNNGGRAWFYKDYIEGDVDFIWGTLDVGLFEECVININGEDTNAGYIFASRTVETNAINKGFVLFNSTIKVPSSSFKAYYGRNSGADTQAAVINCTLTNMVQSALWGSAATKNTFEENGDAGVAYKDYGNVLSDGTAVDVSGRLDRTYTMSKRVALREYNGRYAILNRGFDVDTKAYKAGEVWDISAYETEFNATKDESNKNVYVEPVFKQNVVGGQTVQLAGSSAASGVTYTFESSDTSIATVDANGKVTAASGVTGWATITMTGSNGKKDYFQIGVIPEVIPATAVSVSVADAEVAKYGLTTATVSFTPSTATVQTVKLTSANTSVKFYDEANKTFVTELTTEKASVRVWVGGDVSGATITAESTAYTSATKGTATVSTKEGEATWCAEAGSYRMNTDIQSGKAGLWDNLIIDSESDNNTLITEDGKMGLKGAEKMQIKNVTLYIPVEGASTITLNHSSEVTTSDSLYYSIGSDATKKFTADATKKVFTYTYDGSATGIVLGSDSSIPTSFATSAGSSVNANTKYLKVNAVGGDRYITSIDVKKTGDFTATWEEAPEVQGASGTYNLVKSTNSDDTFTATGTNKIYNFASNDGYVEVKNLDCETNTNYGVISSTTTATIKLAGPSKIKWTGANNGTRANFTVTESAGSKTLVDGVKTSWVSDSSDEGLFFIYTGSTETTLTLSWNATAYIKTLVVSSIESTEANTATKIEVTGESSVTTTTKLKATVTPKYLNTNDGCTLTDSLSWSSSADSYATVTETTTLGAMDKTTGLYTSTEATVTYVANGETTITATYGSVESKKNIKASSSAVEYTQYSWNFMKAAAGTSWTSAESSSKSISSTTSWSASNGSHGISGKATTMTIPTDGAATVYVFVTYQGNNASTLGLYDGETQIGNTHELAVAETKAGKAYAWRYTGSSKTLDLKIADKTSGSQGTTYIGSIYVDRSAMPSSLTACTYDLTNETTFDGSVAANAGETTLFWHEVSSKTSSSNANGYYNGSYGLQENNGTYLAFAVGGACKIKLNVSYNASNSTQTATLYNSAHTSQGTVTIAAGLNGGKSNPTGYDFTYSGSADILYIALPNAGTCVSSVVVESN